jgi:hypothetical protein
MIVNRTLILLAAFILHPLAASANVITDWDEKAVTLLQPRFAPPVAYRAMAIIELAMFEAVNSVDQHYQPYRTLLQVAPDTSQEAAAATAAAVAMTKLVPDAASDIQTALTTYLAGLPDGSAKANGIKLGTEAAEAMLQARADDGSAMPDAYRPVTTAGVYIPTPNVVAPQWPNLKPFVMTSASQFRAPSPVALNSEQWAKDYNEIKELGERNSSKRSARQTEDAKFWLLTGPLSTHPLERQIVLNKKMTVTDSARFLALIAAAEADAMIAVMDAKYNYGFWRPVTAIRNGDIDGNDATERVPTWLPIDNTPMHPEYPCAHCIVSSTVAAAAEAMLGTADVGEVTMVSSTAPGVTHRWTNLNAYTDEVAEARICAGFHYRFSTIAGRQMGRDIGSYAAKTILLPLQAGANPRR